eukprot:97125-Chlamydomonas_euryale.AAC.1
MAVCKANTPPHTHTCIHPAVYEHLMDLHMNNEARVPPKAYQSRIRFKGYVSPSERAPVWSPMNYYGRTKRNNQTISSKTQQRTAKWYNGTPPRTHTHAHLRLAADVRGVSLD